MKRVTQLLLLPIALVLTALFPKIVMADPPGDLNTWLGGIDMTKWPAGISSLAKARSWSEAGQTLVPAFFQMAFFISILLCLGLAIRAGLMFILAEGNKEGLVKARTALVQTFVGFALVLSVFLIFNVVQLVLGVNLTGNSLFGIDANPNANWAKCGKQYCP